MDRIELTEALNTSSQLNSDQLYEDKTFKIQFTFSLEEYLAYTEASWQKSIETTPKLRRLQYLPLLILGVLFLVFSSWPFNIVLSGITVFVFIKQAVLDKGKLPSKVKEKITEMYNDDPSLNGTITYIFNVAGIQKICLNSNTFLSWNKVIRIEKITDYYVFYDSKTSGHIIPARVLSNLEFEILYRLTENELFCKTE